MTALEAKMDVLIDHLKQLVCCCQSQIQASTIQKAANLPGTTPIGPAIYPPNVLSNSAIGYSNNPTARFLQVVVDTVDTQIVAANARRLGLIFTKSLITPDAERTFIDTEPIAATFNGFELFRGSFFELNIRDHGPIVQSAFFGITLFGAQPIVVCELF